MRDHGASTAMCECAHHWNVHAESNLTAQTAICHGYTGSATPGPLRQPCRCTGFAQWTGPRDSRTGEPVKPVTLTIDARIKQPVRDLPDAARIPAEEAFAKVYNDPVTLAACLRAALEAAAPALRAQGAEAERARIRQLAISHGAICTQCSNPSCIREHAEPFADLLDIPHAVAAGRDAGGEQDA